MTVVMIDPAYQKSCNRKEKDTFQTESPHLAKPALQTDLANFGVAVTGNPDHFSYPCIGCDRSAWCKDNKGCQMFMIWNLMSVFE